MFDRLVSFEGAEQLSGAHVPHPECAVPAAARQPPAVRVRTPASSTGPAWPARVRTRRQTAAPTRSRRPSAPWTRSPRRRACRHRSRPLPGRSRRPARERSPFRCGRSRIRMQRSIRSTAATDRLSGDTETVSRVSSGTTAPRTGFLTWTAGRRSRARSSSAYGGWPAATAEWCTAGMSSTNRSSPRTGGRTVFAPRFSSKCSGRTISTSPIGRRARPILPPASSSTNTMSSSTPRNRKRAARRCSTCSSGCGVSGTPVDAVGVQAHLSCAGGPPFSAARLRRFLADVAGLGLTIQITELDVTDENAPADEAVRDRSGGRCLQPLPRHCARRTGG